MDRENKVFGPFGITNILKRYLEYVGKLFLKDRRPATCSLDPKILSDTKTSGRIACCQHISGRRNLNCQQTLIFILVTILSQSTLAMPEDREKTAQLAANTADLNQQTHHGEYLGDVQFDQGTTHLRAAKAITEGNQQNKLILAVAFGDKKEPAHYWEQTAIDKPLLHAYANEIRYYPERHIIELIGNARVVQGDNSFAAPKISYDTQKQHVVSQQDGQQRTVIIIHPGKKL